MNLVVGLGNPGREYAKNRHNIGFMVVEELLRRTRGTLTGKFKGQLARVDLQGRPTLLLEPMTYMNRSGESVGACAQYHGVDLEHLVVVHDELDLPFGEIRVKNGGGLAGHNGLKSIFQHLGSGDFARVRVGIGRPQRGAPTDHVLSDFDADEAAALPAVIDRAADAVIAVLDGGVLSAMNQFNQKKKPSPKQVEEGE